MTLSITLPQLSPKSASTKDLIISILSEEWPLTARSLCSKLQREGSASLSYQAVHKSLLGLEREKIVEKIGKGYQIDLDWLNNLRKFSDKTIESYKLDKTSDFDGGKVLDFYNPFDFFRGMLNIFASRTLIEKDSPNYGCGCLKHLWWPLNFNKEEFEKFKIMGETYESYVICANDTPVDRWLKDYYLKAGFNGIKLGADYKFEDDFAVIGNYYLQIFFPESMKKMNDKLFSSVKDMSGLINKGFLENLFRQKTHIRVIIIRNPELCRQLRQRQLSYFKEDESKRKSK